MKKKLGIICSILTMCVVLSLSNVCFAENNDNSLNLVHAEFVSGGQDASHQFVTNQAISIINNDKGNNIAKYLLNYKDTIMLYSDMPDIDENDYAFAYHFYNPYTGRNYLPSDIPASLETGLVRVVKHAEAAKQNYATNREYSMEELGRACHYLADVNEPHHASNLIAGISYHSQFEKFINERNEQYKVTTSDKYNEFSAASSYSEYCTLLCDDSAKFAYGYKDLANASKGLLEGGDEEKWNIAGIAVMKNTQESIAAFLYSFLKSVEKI